MNLKISVNKIQIIRPETTLKISDLDLNTNWTIDYVEINSKSLEYLCIINIDEIFLNFTIQGLIECDGNQILGNRFREFNSLITDKSIKIMMRILEITDENTIHMKSIVHHLNPYHKKNFVSFNFQNGSKGVLRK